MQEQEGTAGAAGTVIRTAAEIVAAAPKIGTDVVEVPEWGTGVRVTGISKVKQEKIATDATNPDTGESDAKVVEMSMFMHGVIEPTFTEEQVEALWETAPGPINRVLKRILQLSGTAKTDDAVKAAVRTFPKEQATEV